MRSFLLAASAAVAAAVIGFDVSQPVSVDSAKCMKGYGDFAVVRGWCSFGGVDSSVSGSVAAFWDAGFSHVDVYGFPCRGQSATTQVNSFVDYLQQHGVKFGQIWIDVETNPSPGCAWEVAEDPVTGIRNETLAEDNCAFIAEWNSAVRARGIAPGTYASSYMWNSIAGSSCTSSADTSLWYPHYDGNPSFSDFTPFGGWSKPAIKQYRGTTTVCGVGVDENYYP